MAQNFDWKSLLEPYSWPTVWTNPVQFSFLIADPTRQVIGVAGGLLSVRKHTPQLEASITVDEETGEVIRGDVVKLARGGSVILMPPCLICMDHR